MIKKTVKCEDFDGNPYEKDCYFHLSEAELLEFETSVHGGVSTLFDKITKETDNVKLMEYFKKFLMMAYGDKGLDGKTFDKSEAAKKAFEYSPAYSEIAMELFTDPDAQIAFIVGVLPKKVTEKPEFQAATTSLANKIKDVQAAEKQQLTVVN